MTKQIRISTSQQFTEMGKIGVYMFLFGPIASAGFYYWLVTELAKGYSRNPLPPAFFLTAAGLVFLGSIPLMLVGRTQQHHVIQTEV